MSLSHFFSITQTWRIAISWLDTPGRILSSTWYHRWLQLVTPMRQNAQKRSRKFCRSKEDKNGETHPIQPEKGETGCVSGAGEGCSRYGRVGKPEIRTKMHQIAMQHMKKENRRKPSVFAGFVAGAEGLGLGCRLGRRWTVATGDQRPTTRTAGGPAGAPRCQILPHINEKSQVPYKRYLTFLCFLSKNDALG